MFKRFDNYLTNEFRGLPHTKEVSDFKEELLGVLMEKAEDLKQAGKESEDEIFKICIGSITGFKDTLKVLRGKPVLVKEAKKAVNVFMYVLLYFMVVIGAFLAVSFVTLAWDRSWMIIVAGAFLFFIASDIFLAVKGFLSSKYVGARLAMSSAIAFCVVGVYLGISFYTGMWATSWLIMLCLPEAILFADCISLLLMGKYKAVFAEAIIIIPLVSVFVYLALAILGIITWHPYWLIILGGVFVDIAIITVAMKIKTNN